MVYLLTGSFAWAAARVCVWKVQLNTLSPAVASFCSSELSDTLSPVSASSCMVRPLFKELKNLQEKKYICSKICSKKNYSVALSFYKSFNLQCYSEAYWLMFCVLNICNYICGCFITEMPLVLWNVRGVAFQRSGDLQCMWTVPCFARTFLFLLEKLCSYTIKQNNKR